MSHKLAAVVILLAASSMPAAPALAVNSCHAQTLSCPTTMPVGGYCECTAHGVTQSGTVTPRPAPGRKTNATAGGCGAHPGAPGC